MQRLIWTVIAAFALAMISGPFVIPWLKRLKVGQTINSLGPKSHAGKQGTATMGGVIFVFSALAATLIFCPYEGGSGGYLPLMLITMFAFAAIGAADDYIKVVKSRSMGLTPAQKLIPQIICALAIAIYAYLNPFIGPALRVPFSSAELNLGIAYIPVMAFVIVGVVNSANLLDGLDGLLSGSAMLNFGTFALIALSLGAAADGMDADLYNTALFSGAMCGALMGFLRFNTHPAGVFMGDVGSFAIGGALAGVALVTRLALILPIVAFAMMISSLSDILQMAYFRFTHGRRILRMAPLHHHFELGGIPETRIVTMYDIMTALLCLAALGGYVS